MMMSLSSKQPFGIPHGGGGGGGGGGLHDTKYPALHTASPCPSAAAPAAASPGGSGSGGGSGGGGGSAGRGSGPGGGGGGGAEAMRRGCLPTPPSNIFGGLDESLLARAEALAAVDIVSPSKSHHHHPPHHSPFKPDATYHTMNTIPCTSAASSSSVPISHPSALSGTHHHHHHHHHHQPHQALEGDLLEHLTPGLALGAMAAPDGAVVSTPGHAPHMAGMTPMHPAALGMAHAHGLPAHMGCVSDVDADPRDLEAFAERFKQRRIKLGVTQADVGSALANLKIPGVGSLSQSTICRFESLTLSHNNMIALKPILQAWLEEAEKAHREKLAKPELFAGAEKKRKRTSIAAPEKRSLEAYFALQPRPSSEKIAAIAEKLDLKKNVVRVWFCNQRQKQKRMKYSAGI
ncbi:POU domain, class 4, transcription factor 2 [Apteryx mantelli]|uniref:POU domain protein n=1 Tax=Apteryx mantelli TaxID=2696672 RepID=A0ABM4EKI5_9AVES